MKVFGHIWTLGTVCACAQRPPIGTFQGSMVRTASSFSSSSRRSHWWLQATCRPTLFVFAETLKACALIGLHLLAAEGEPGSGGSQSPYLGDMWKQGCPSSPEWISSRSASETSFGCEVYEHINECRAIEVIGQDWLSEVVPLFLEDWVGRVALSCHMAMDLLCQDMSDACPYSSESLAPCSL